MRVRPTRRSRPRTKIRPKHAEAVPGFVIAVDRGRYTCRVDDTDVTAMRARELGRKGVVVGDRVALDGDTSGDDGTLARIVRIEPRHGQLRRTADDDDDKIERIIVANVDQLVIVCALADPPVRTGFIDRCLVAAFDADIQPLLCLTKADIGADALPEIDRYYADLDVPYVTCRPDEPIDDLAERLDGKLSVLIGHSGVGKSTLVNRLVPDADRSVGDVSAIGRGRHTSTNAVALELPDGSWIVDTPGVRSFGLAHVSSDSLLHAFGDLADVATGCEPGCDHTGQSGVCALDSLRDADGEAPQRLQSYRRLLAAIS
ncbi:Small ribosomal subunit biogenesis GTPase RsgA [Stackebrandtia soli]